MKEIQKKAEAAFANTHFVRTSYGDAFQLGYITGHAAALESTGWIDCKDRLPEVNADGTATANVFAIEERHKDILVMNYCYQHGEDAEGKAIYGGVWSNCYGDIYGDGEWDDEYIVTKWMPLPLPPTSKP